MFDFRVENDLKSDKSKSRSVDPEISPFGVKVIFEVFMNRYS